MRDKPIKQRSTPCQRHVRAKKELSKSHPVWCVRCGWARRANLIEEYLIKDGVFEQYIEVETTSGRSEKNF